MGDKRNSEGKLPLLVYNLIEFAREGLEDIFMPTEDRVIMSGPDGNSYK